MPQTLKLTPREEALLRYAMSTAATFATPISPTSRI